MYSLTKNLKEAPHMAHNSIHVAQNSATQYLNPWFHTKHFCYYNTAWKRAAVTTFGSAMAHWAKISTII